MSDIEKEMREKISTMKWFGSITRADIQGLLRLIDQQAEQLEKFQEENIKLLASGAIDANKNVQLRGAIKRQDSTLELAVKALEWYANEVNYLPCPNLGLIEYVLGDKGERARQFLEEIKRLEGVTP